MLETVEEAFLKEGQVFLPLLLDPEIQREAGVLGEGETAPGATDSQLASWGGRVFVRAISLSALVDHYPLVYPEAYGELCRGFEEHYCLTGDLWGVAVAPELPTILFHILPHFVRRGGAGRRLKDEGEVLDFIREETRIPGAYYQRARQFLDTTPLEAALARLGEPPGEPPLPPAGVVRGSALKAWWRESLRLRWLVRTRERLVQALKERERAGRYHQDRLAALLWLAELPSFEVAGFGFEKLGRGPGYCIYKRTGPFALQDYYGRVYLFPDCRVAVATQGRLRPVVLEPYKHPFLRRHKANQEICLGSGYSPRPFSAANAIRALEAGLNALFYSYDRRRRNGYHSLDDPPGKERLVHFDDYRLPADHPLITSGQVEIKNQAT
uniref:Uncharacterized protein n=1 Tax=Desulfobacca acetoxidans TaxID=60893 RepID=A0A7V4LCK0_9BACT